MFCVAIYQPVFQDVFWWLIPALENWRKTSVSCMNIGNLSWTRPPGETGFVYRKSVEQLPKDADLCWGLCMCSCRAPPDLGRVWKSGFCIVRLGEVLSIITHGWDHWTAMFCLFETREFVYVPMYRIRCNHFSIFVLTAQVFMVPN